MVLFAALLVHRSVSAWHQYQRLTLTCMEAWHASVCLLVVMSWTSAWDQPALLAYV